MKELRGKRGHLKGDVRGTRTSGSAGCEACRMPVPERAKRRSRLRSPIDCSSMDCNLMACILQFQMVFQKSGDAEEGLADHYFF